MESFKTQTMNMFVIGRDIELKKYEDFLAELDEMEDKLSNLKQGYNNQLVVIEKLEAENKRYRDALDLIVLEMKATSEEATEDEFNLLIDDCLALAAKALKESGK